jgi:hypothetical protein
VIYADVVELADTLDLGSSGQPCRFDSCHPHQKKDTLKSVFFLATINGLKLIKTDTVATP